jgi:diguanylate cyclase (GGDEF)-like protein/putative nucleotidyltransferase with HDIG domain
MLDLDGLKEINDTLGHGAGDDRLRATADCLTATLPAAGGAYRTGGDEFMVLLPDEPAWGALAFAKRFETEAARHRTAPLVSCGIAEASQHAGGEALRQQADLALYHAKRSGRRIVVYSAGINTEAAVPADEMAARRHRRLVATALAQAVDAKDAGTRSHCETVSTLCVVIGQELGLSAERVEQLRLAGLLHDVGKIGIADAVLRKAGRLDPDERYAMSSHVRVGHSIVAAAGFAEEAEWILRHHEHLDGSGYPEGVGGRAIPLEARIIQVADAFEAMTADRPYRRALGQDEAFAELGRGAGKQFDATCVAALRSALGTNVTTAARWLAPADDDTRPFPLQAAA